MGHLIICHSYGGRLSDCQLCGDNYKNVLKNSNSSNILSFLLTWHARSASQLENGPLTLEDRRQKSILPRRVLLNERVSSHLHYYTIVHDTEAGGNDARRWQLEKAIPLPWPSDHLHFCLRGTGNGCLIIEVSEEKPVFMASHRVRDAELFKIDVKKLTWRTIHESAELLKATKAVIVNDGMYWLLLNEASSHLCREILTLNLTDERFSKIAIPDAVKNHNLGLFEGEGKLRLLSTHSDGSNNIVSDIWVADLTSQDWIHLQTIVPRMPVGISPFFQLKTKIFFGNQKRLLCVDLQDGTVSYINMPPGETLISCGMFVESFAPAVTGMVSSTAASYGIRSRLAEPSSADPGPSFRGAGSSSASHGRSSGLTGWSSADLEQSFKRTKRTTNMQWKISKHRAS
ncbi:uncharacterized protein [Miscanthus floridulus]|uniref:uncharacterized protein n=1 Tax=Miscanthus floridulus TaxID=154761 RepID=UPI0034591B75